MPEKKFNAYEWAGWYGVRFWDVVLDPDGWDRTQLDLSLLELITQDEFNRRLAMSTVNHLIYNKMERSP